MPRVKSTLTLARMGCVVLILLLAIGGAQAQAVIDMVIFRSADSLTVYLPPSTSVSISGLTLEATTATGRNLSQLLEQLPSFRGLPYDRLPTPICFHITRAVNSPLPLECQTITTLTQTLVDANVFWYDISSRVDRTLVVYFGENAYICPAGSPRCDLSLSPIPTPTPELLGFEGYPVTMNSQWETIGATFTDDVDMMFVPVGCFTMGSTNEEIQYAVEELGAIPEWIQHEQPAVVQCFETPFFIDKTEVTQADFARLGGTKAAVNANVGQQLPVDSITWLEAGQFCALRGARLPTEAEWEYAARGPNSLIFPWGDFWNPSYAIWLENRGSGPTNVGIITEGRSWTGALDMSGNVWEWVSTIYGISGDDDGDFFDLGETLFPYPYDASDGREMNSTDENIKAILRGGSFMSEADLLRSAVRSWHPASGSLLSGGFRCARDY